MDNRVNINVNNWLNGKYDEATKQTIIKMQQDSPKELQDSFYTSLEFGTGGLRGLMGVGTNRMNIYTVAMATQGLANYLNEQFKGEPISVAISYDNRHNNITFANIAADVFSANGIKIYIFQDMRPTPELSFAIREFGCQSGVMITASHNPKEYNGYKAYWSDGAQIVEPHDVNIINNVNNIVDLSQVKWERNKELVELIPTSFDQKFIDYTLSQRINSDVVESCGSFGIVYTPIHGAGGTIMPEALRQYGFTNVQMVEKQAIADGDFPTVIHPNPEDPKALEMAIELAKSSGAELVLASDPDADRIAFAVKEPSGEFLPINGNQAASLLSYYIIKARADRGMMRGNEFVVKTIVTTNLISKIAEDFGVECMDTLTGFKFIAGAIRENEGKKQFLGGGEESYGYMIGDGVRDKDSITSGAMIAEIMAWAKSQNKSIIDILVELYIKYGMFHEEQIAITKKGMEGVQEIAQMMQSYRTNPPKELAGDKVVKVLDYLSLEESNFESGEKTPINQPKSNVLQFVTAGGSIVSVRPSGTEPKIKFYFGVCEPLKCAEDYHFVAIQLKEKVAGIVESLSL